MRTMVGNLWPGAIVLAVAMIGGAMGAEVRVAYEVDQKSFKKGVSSEDVLTFGLYDDSACTNLLFQADLAAGAAEVTYEQPKRTKVKGGLKPTKVTVIGTVLDLGEAPGPLFAMVTGAGIAPVGGPCQVQGAAPPANANYFTSSFLNVASIDAGASYTKMGDFVSFTKEREWSRIEVILNSRVRGGVFGSGTNGVQFQVRVDDLEPDLGGVAAITSSNTIDFLSIIGVFEDLPAGSHTASVWMKAGGFGGTTTGAMLDPSGWGARMLVKEVD